MGRVILALAIPSADEKFCVVIQNWRKRPILFLKDQESHRGELLHHLLGVRGGGVEMFMGKKEGKEGAECDIGIQIMFILPFEKLVGFGLRRVIDARRWSHSLRCRIVHGVIITIVSVTKLAWSLGFNAVNTGDEGVKLG